ncbi:hypothetical protein [Roseateles noduli]|uniref:hypothetical protein n=1 Tax=Roseateles noduli TaxID=2052484 RepID=UPI003D646EEA
MPINEKNLSLVLALYRLTLLREIEWHMVRPTTDPNGDARGVLRYETTHEGFHFAVYQLDHGSRHRSMNTDLWTSRHVLAVLDDQGLEIWHESGSLTSVDDLFRLVQRRLTCIDQVFAKIVAPIEEERAKLSAQYEEEERGVRGLVLRLKRSLRSRFAWARWAAARAQ